MTESKPAREVNARKSFGFSWPHRRIAVICGLVLAVELVLLVIWVVS